MAYTSVFILSPDFPKLEGVEAIGGTYPESLAAAKRLGYDGVEITMGDPDQFDVSAFKALLREHQLKVSAINSGGIQYLFKASLVSADERRMELALEKLKSNIRHCRELGCLQQVGVARGFAVPGRPMRWFKDCLVDVLKEAAAYAAERQVPMVLEYTNRFEINTINTGAEAREIVDRVGSPNLGILIDTSHSFLEDPDVYQNIRDLNGRVWHFHLHDSNGGAAIIGGGENDFDRIMRACGEIGYHNWFSDGLSTLKYPEEELRRSTSTLRELYQKYGV
ncbi:MAG: sugar phosphate isomerase/epimerase [Acidobacteria bacterium]|nr:sugar phosphate isomerase/epimerase [Acidobacteriota bacterium]